jgi:sulfoxide reductase heme-binding subunit YedZ
MGERARSFAPEVDRGRRRGRGWVAESAPEEEEGGGGFAWLLLFAVVAASLVAGGAMAVVPRAAQMWPWALGRAAGLVSFLLVTVVVLLGIWQSHPWNRRWAGFSLVLSHRAHVLLTLFTLFFVLLHALSLALDPYAGVGFVGMLIPGAATYRSIPVALGVLALYAGLLTGITAGLGPRLGRRVWLPIHRWAVLILVAGWFHGVLAGSDTLQLRPFYAITGGAVLVLAVTRYLGARAPARRAGAPRPEAWPAAAPTRGDGQVDAVPPSLPPRHADPAPEERERVAVGAR